MTLKDRVKELAKKKGISLPTLEAELGFGNSTIVKWDKSTPNAEKLNTVAQYFDVTMDYLLNGIANNTSYPTCPDCGLCYNATNEDDLKYHERLHSAWEEATKKFGKLYCDNTENETIKAKNRNISHDLTRPIDERYNAQIEVLRCLFSRSLSSCDFDLSHVPFEQYVSMLLGNGSYRKHLDNALYQKLVDNYGVSSGIPYGRSYYTPHQPSTLAAHFDGDEYTESEMNEIKQFAAFVKNKRQS